MLFLVLMNASGTFQREMDIAFVEENDKFVVVYMDKITIFSKSERDHIKHLKRVFLKCRRFVIYFNPIKSNFSMKEGKLLGHIISKDGITIDPDRGKAILKYTYQEIKKNLVLLNYFIIS